jgi:hypothetical protein
MQEKSAFFGIPKGVFDDPAAYAHLTSLSKVALTDCRSSIKQKVYDPLEDFSVIDILLLQLSQSLQTTKSRNRPQTISELTKSVAPKGMEVTSNHWSRMAYLVSLFPVPPFIAMQLAHIYNIAIFSQRLQRIET